MKKLILFFIIFIFLIPYGYSQTDPPNTLEGVGALIGLLSMMDKVSVGVNQSNLYSDDAYNTKPLTGIYAGLSISMVTPNNPVNLDFEFVYSQKGGKQIFDNLTNEFNVHTIQIGVLYRVKPFRKWFVIPQILAGFQTGINIPGKNTIYYSKSRDYKNINTIVDITDTYPKFDYGPIIGFGLDFVAHKGEKIKRIVGLDFRYTLGLSTIMAKKYFKDSNDYEGEAYKVKSNVWAVNLTFYYIDLFLNLYR